MKMRGKRKACGWAICSAVATAVSGGLVATALGQATVPTVPTSNPAHAASAATGPFIPAGATLGKIYPIRATAGNRGVQVEILNGSLESAYGSLKAAPGRQLLVLSTEWENVIPYKIVNENDTPTAYAIPALWDHLYVVADGKTVGRVVPRNNELPGHVPVKEFNLPKIGDRVAGNLIFDLPAGPIKSLELRFYDLAHGHFDVALGDPAAAPAESKSPNGAQRNDVVEVASYGVQRMKEYAGRTATEGMAFYAIDFRGRSTFTADADATAFDPNAKPKTKIKKGIFADWTESRKYIHLVADGEYAYTPEPQTELLETPRFLPDVLTGGTLVFLAPEKATSLELRCDFPNARIGARVYRPAGLTLALEGRRPVKMPERPAVAAVDDDVFKVAVVGQTSAETFAGAKPQSGGRFLVLDVTVQNVGKQGEFFQTKEQLQYADAAGKASPISDATYAGPRRPAPLIWIPSKEQRTFQVVYEIAATEAKPRLTYTGVSLAKVLDLKPIGETVTSATTPPGPKGDPVQMTTRPAAGTPATPATPSTPPAKPANAEAKLPQRVAAKQPHAVKGLAGVGLTGEQVNAAIDRGGKYLWELKRKELEERTEAYSAEQVFTLLALVHADVHKKDPACDVVVRRALGKTSPHTLGTYGAAIYCMLAESYGDVSFLPNVQEAARYLMEGQGPEGTWGYQGNGNEKLYAKPPEDESLVLKVRGGVPLEGPGSGKEQWTRITPWAEGRDGDNSCTQYAILGLHAASRMGVRLPADVWKRCEAALRERQGVDGSWDYHTKAAGYGTMTCAGIATLTLCRHEQGEKSPAVDAGVENGLGWLDANFSVTKNPKQDQYWVFYYLYGLERVGRILNTEFVGDHEWYPYGARHLLGIQKPEGGWLGTGQEATPELATAFALMFLTRATPSLDVAKQTGPGRLTTEVVPMKGHRVYIILDCSGTMMEQTDGVERVRTAKEAMAKLVAELPDGTQVGVRAFGHRKVASVVGANEDTELVVPMQALDKAQRVAAVEKINALRPRGKTPLSLTLQQAAADVGGGGRENPVTVVLVTDGGEDNTRPKVPVLQAAETLGKVPGMSFYVVGFDVQTPEWRQQLADLSTRGGGRYLSAERAASLLPELRTAVFRIPESFKVTDAKGTVLAAGAFGEQKPLPEGKYTFTTQLSDRQFAREIWVNANSTTAVRFDPVRIDWSQATPAVAKTPPTPAAPATPGVPATKPPVAKPPVATTPPMPPKPPTATLTPPTVTPGAKKFCTHCGKPITATAKFCSSCGTKVGP